MNDTKSTATDGNANAKPSTSHTTRPSSVEPWLNRMTASAQVVVSGAYQAARQYYEFAEATRNPERAAHYQRMAIQWQADAAEISARQRANYLRDNPTIGALAKGAQ